MIVVGGRSRVRLPVAPGRDRNDSRECLGAWCPCTGGTSQPRRPIRTTFPGRPMSASTSSDQRHVGAKLEKVSAATGCRAGRHHRRGLHGVARQDPARLRQPRPGRPAAGPHAGPGREGVPAPGPGARPADRDRPADDRHVPAGAAAAERGPRRHRAAGPVHPHRDHDRPRPRPAGPRAGVRRRRPPQGAAHRRRHARPDVAAVRARPQHRDAVGRPGRAGRGRCRDLRGRDGRRPRPVLRPQGRQAAQPPHPRPRRGPRAGPEPRRVPAQRHQLARHLLGAGRRRGAAGRARVLRPARDPAEGAPPQAGGPVDDGHLRLAAARPHLRRPGAAWPA